MIENIQAQQQTNPQYKPSDEFHEELVKAFKSASKVQLEYSRPVESVDNDSPVNTLRFEVKEDGVQAQVLNKEGDIIRTIPPSDLMDLLNSNAMKTMGNIIDFFA